MNNRNGFTPQRGTIDAAMAVKDFVEKGLVAGDVIVLVTLDVKGAFDADWWPIILNGLKACGWPKIIYNLTNSYFSQRTAALSTNRIWMERVRVPQGSCCGPGFWNILYNSLTSNSQGEPKPSRVLMI